MFGFSHKKEWFPVAMPTQWPEGNLFTTKISGKKIVFSLIDGLLHAFNDECPHAGFSLSENNALANGCIACPLHGYKFKVRTGLCVSGEEYRLHKYKLEQRDDGWYVEV